MICIRKTRLGSAGMVLGLFCSYLLFGAQPREDPERSSATVIRFGARSAWTANTRSGASLGGTWSGEIDLSAGTASGTWTLRDGAGRIVLHGTWSAVKEDREWRGDWRARIVGQPKERSGSWSAQLQLSPGAPLAELFERALQQAVSGTWQSAGQSGGWSIRAVK